MAALDLIYHQQLGTIVLWIFLLVAIWAVGRFLFGDRSWWRIGNAVGVIVAAYGILHFTVLHRESSSPSSAILLPFHSFIEAQIQPEKYREMLMNVFLFVPFGLTAPNGLSRIKRFWPTVITVASALLLSTTIEFTQFYFHCHRSRKMRIN